MTRSATSRSWVEGSPAHSRTSPAQRGRGNRPPRQAGHRHWQHGRQHGLASEYEIDTELIDPTSRVGEADAVRAYQLGLEADRDQVEDLTHVLGDDCGFDAKTSLYLASKESHVDKLRREYECRRHYGFDVRYLESNEIQETFRSRPPGDPFKWRCPDRCLWLYTWFAGACRKKGAASYTTDGAVTAIEQGRGARRPQDGPVGHPRSAAVVFATGQ